MIKVGTVLEGEEAKAATHAVLLGETEGRSERYIAVELDEAFLGGDDENILALNKEVARLTKEVQEAKEAVASTEEEKQKLEESAKTDSEVIENLKVEVAELKKEKDEEK